MLLEIDDKSMQLENQKKHEEQAGKGFSEEIQLLKSENEKLTVEISCLSEQVKQKEILSSDLELMKKSLEEYEILLNTRKEERNELVSTIALLKKEAERSLDELNRMMHLKDEEEKVSRLLHSELEALKVQYSDLKRSLIDDEAEKENLRQQIFHLRSELKKKDDALTTIASIPQNSKEMTNLSEKIKMLEVNLQIPVIEQIGPLRKMLDNQILIPLYIFPLLIIIFVPLHFSYELIYFCQMSVGILTK
jgi:hypothetical protein